MTPGNAEPKTPCVPVVTVLLVDDEKEFVETLAQRLASRNYRVAWALSGPEALCCLAESKTFDVVLLDLELPGLDGLQILTRIKTDQPLVEIVLLTAHTSTATAVKAMRFGAFDYVVKPCDLDALAEKLEAAAERKRRREKRICDVHSRPYITDRQKRALIAEILAS